MKEFYSEEGLMAKLGPAAAAAGCEVVRAALLLYAVLTGGASPTWARAAVVAALGYFVWPADAVPDIIPVVGFADDSALMTALLSRLGSIVTPEVRGRAESLLPSACR